METDNEDLKTVRSQLDTVKKQCEDYSSQLEVLRLQIIEKDDLVERKHQKITSQQSMLDETNSTVSTLETKLKQLNDELACEQHNSEASRSSLQVKLAEQEKAHKLDLSRVNDALCSIEDELRKNKQELNRELSQCHSDLHNVQAELNKSNLASAKLEDEVKRHKQQVIQLEQLKQHSDKKCLELDLSNKGLNKENLSLQQKLDTCENKCISFEEKISCQCRDIKSYKKQVIGLEQHLAIKEKEMIDVKQKYETARQNQDLNMDSLKSQFDQSETRRKKAEEYMKGVESEIKHLTSNLDMMEKRSSDLSSQLERLQVKCTELSCENKSLSEKNKSISSQLDVLNSDLIKEREKNQKMLSHHDEINTSWEQKLTLCQSSSREEISMLLDKQQEDVGSLNKKIKVQDDLLSKLTNDVNSKVENLKTAQEELLAVKTFAEKLRNTNMNLDAEKLKQESKMKEMKSKINDLQSRLVVVSEQHTFLLDKHQTLEEYHAVAAAESKENLIERHYLEGRVQDLENQVGKLKVDADALISLQKNVDEMKADKVTLLAEVSELKEKVKESDQKLCDKDAEQVELQDRITRYALDKENITNELNKVIASVELRINEYESKIQHQKVSLESIQQAHDLLEDYKQQVEEDLTQTRLLVQVLQDSNLKLEKSLTDMKLELNKKDETILHLQCDNERLQSSCDEAVMKHSEQNKLLQDKLGNLAELRSQYEEVKNHVLDLEKSLCSSSCKIDTLKSNNELLLKEKKETLEVLEKERSASSSLIQSQSQELSDLKNTNSLLQLSLTDLQARLDSLVTTKSSLSEEVQSLQSQISLTEEKFTKKQKEYDAIVLDLSQSLAQSNSTSASLALDYESLKLAFEEVEREKNSSCRNAEVQLQKMQEYEEEVGKLKKNVSDVSDDNISLRATLIEVTTHNEELNTELSSLQHEMNDKSAQILSLHTQHDNDQSIRNDLQSELEQSNNNVSLITAQLKSLQQEVNQLSSYVIQLKNEHASEQTSLMNDLQSSKVERESLAENIIQLKQDLADANTTCKNLKVKNKDLVERISDLETDIEKLTSNLEFLQMDFDDRDDLIKKLETSVIPALQAEVKDKTETIFNLKNSIKEMEEELNLSSTKFDVCLADKDLLHEKLALVAMQHEQQLAITDSLTNEVELLQQDKKSLDENIEKLHENLQEKTRCKNDLETKFDCLNDQRDKQNQTIQHLTDNLNAASSLSEQLEKDKNEMKKHLLVVEKKYEKINEDNLAMKVLLNEKKTLVKSHLEKNEELNKSLEDYRKKYDAKVEEYEQKCSNLHDQFDKKVKDYEDECEALHSELKNFRKNFKKSECEASNMESLYERMCDDNTQLRAENETLLNQVTIASKTLMDLEDQLVETEKQVEEKQKVIDDIKDEYVELLQSKTTVMEEKKFAVAKVAELVDECENLRLKLDQCSFDYELQVRKLSEEMKNVFDELEETQSQLTTELSEKNAALLKAEEFEKQKLGLELIIEEMTRKHQDQKDLNKEFCLIEEKLVKLDGKRRELEKQNQDLLDREYNLVQSKEKMNRSLMEITENLQNAEKKLEKSLLENKELFQKYSDANSSLFSLRITTDDQIKCLSQTVDQLNYQLRCVRRNKNTSDKQLKESEEGMQMLDKQVSLLVGEVGRCLVVINCLKTDGEYHQQTIDRLKSEVDENNEKRSKQDERIMELEENVNLLEEEVLNLRSAHSILSIQNHDKDIEIDKINSNLDAVVEELEIKLKSFMVCDEENHTLPSETIYSASSVIPRKLAQCKTENHVLESRLSKLVALHEDVEMCWNKEEKKLEEVSQNFLACKQELKIKSNEIVILHEKVTTLDERFLLSEKKCGDISQSLDELHLEYRDRIAAYVAKHKSEEDSWLEESSRLKSEINLLENTLQQCQEQINSGAEVVKQKEKQVEEMKIENKELSTLFENSVSSCNQLQEEVTQLTIKLTDHLRDSQVAHEHYQTLSDQTEIIAREKESLTQVIDQLKLDNHELHSKLSHVSNELQCIEAERGQLNIQAKDLQKVLSDMEEKLTVTSLKHASEVSSLEEKLRSASSEASLEKLNSEKLISSISAELEETKTSNNNLQTQLTKVEDESINKGKKVAILKHKLKSSHDDIAHLSLKHQHQCSLSSQLQLDFEKKSDELNKTLNLVSTKDAQLVEVKGHFNQLQSQLEETNQKMNAAQESNSELENQIKTLNESLNELETKFTSQSEQLTQCQDELARLDEDKSSLLEKDRELTNLVDDVTSRLRHSESELSCSSDSYEKQIKGLEDKLSNLEEERSSWCVQEESMKTELERHMKIISDMQIKTSEYEKEVEDKQSSINDLESTKKIQLENIERYKEEIEKLHIDNNLKIKEKQTKIDHLVSTSASLDEELSCIRTCLQEKEDSIKMKEEEMNELKESICSLECEISSYEDRHNKVVQEINNEMDTLRRSKEIEFAEKDEEVTRLCDALQQSALTLKSSTDKCEQLDRDVKSLQLDFEKKSDELNKTLNLVSTKDAQLVEVKGHFDQLQSQLEETNHKMNVAQESNSELENQIKTLNESLSELETKFISQSEQLTQCQDELARLDEEKSSLLEKDRELTNLVDDVTSRLRHSESELSCSSDSYEKQIKDLEDKLSNLKEERSSWCVQEDSMKTELERHMKIISDMQIKTNEYEKEVEDKQLSINDLESTKKIQLENIERYKEEIEKLHIDNNSKIEEKQTEIDRLVSTSASLDEELSCIRTCLQEKEDSIKMKEEEMNELKESICSLECEISSNEDRHNKVVQEINNEMDTLRRSKENEYFELEEDLKKLDESKQNLHEENDLLISQIKLKEKQVDEGRKQLSILEAVLAETSLTNTHMKEELENLKDLIKLDSAKHKKRIEELRDDNEKLLEAFHSLKDASKGIEAERNALSRMQEESLIRINEMKMAEEELMKENKLLEELIEDLKNKNCSSEHIVEEMRSSIEELESTLEQVSIEYGDVEEKWKESENLLEETSLAMDDLRLKLNEEREKVNDQQQTYVESEAKSRDVIASLHQELDELEDKFLEVEEERKKELFSHELREDEMKEYTKKLMDDFSLLNVEVSNMEKKKTSLEEEVAHLQSELENVCRVHAEQDALASSKLCDVLQDVEQLRSAVDSSDCERLRLQSKIDSLEKEMLHPSVVEEELNATKRENMKLKKNVEMLKGKLTLMTTTARRKEKELHRALKAMNGKTSNVLTDQTQTTDSCESPSLTSRPPLVKRLKSKRSSRKSAKRDVVLTQSDDLNSIENSPKKALPHVDSSPNSSPVFQVEGLPHLVNKGFTSIPHGFSSPFVLRRQQLSRTKQFLASAIDNKPGLTSNTDSEISSSKLSQPYDGATSEPLQTLPDTRKSSPPPQTATVERQLRLRLNKSPSNNEDDEAECKVQ